MKAAVAFAAVLLLAVEAAGQRAPRTAWGHPDLQGTWTNVTATPLERPPDLAGKSVLTEEERAERFRQFTRETTTDTVPRVGSTGSHNEYWRERGVLLRRTSLLVDPPDGRLPPLTPEGRRVRDGLATAWKTAPADGPESRDLFERCVTRGLPGTMMGNFYNHNYEILQTPDHVVVLAEMIHDARIIPLHGRPHVDPRIGQWLGDSRGRWEGDTLVVETTNLRAVDQTTISRGLGVITLGTSTAARIVERFTRRGPDAIDYRVTVDDPTIYTAPWTAAVPMTTRQGPLFEYACHEGNYGMTGILAGHRAEERAAAHRP